VSAVPRPQKPQVPEDKASEIYPIEVTITLYVIICKLNYVTNECNVINTTSRCIEAHPEGRCIRRAGFVVRDRPEDGIEERG
jgi:hypothetical protein